MEVIAATRRLLELTKASSGPERLQRDVLLDLAQRLRGAIPAAGSRRRGSPFPVEAG